MTIYKRAANLLFIFLVFLLFSSCSLNNNHISYKEYEKDSIVKIRISNATESYLFICTDDYKVITYDNVRNKGIISDCEDVEIRFLDCFLENIGEADARDVEFDFDCNDFWDVVLYLNEQEYHFTYGVSKEPYVNMLVELIIGCSDYTVAQEALVPYPLTFRDNN